MPATTSTSSGQPAPGSPRCSPTCAGRRGGGTWRRGDRSQGGSGQRHPGPATYVGDWVGAVMNKLRVVLTRPFMADVVGSARSSFDMAADVLDGGLLLVRVPKGILGDETARILGSFVVAQVWQTITARSRTGEAARCDASLYIDECHNFLTLPRSLEDLLAEARGYRLSVVCAHQHLGQLPRELREALSANARN